MSVEIRDEPSDVLIENTVELPVAAIKPAPEPATPAPASGRLYALDLFRFFAAMVVVGFHLIADIGQRKAWGPDVDAVFGAALPAAFRYGWLGVEFFFIISGFAICMSCWGRSLSDFFTSRVTRLMPAYVFAVLVTGTVLMIAPIGGRPALSQVLVNLTMLQQFVGVPSVDDVYWTLFTELRFYILFAVVVWFGLTYRRVVLFNVLWTVLYLFAGLVKFAPLTEVVQPLFAPYFVAGTTLYLMHRFGPNLLLWGMLAVSMAMAVPSVEKRVAAGAGSHLISHKIATLIVFVLFGLMVLLALGKLSWLRWPGLMTLGALTYPTYLLHRQLSWVAVRQWHETVPAWLLAPAIVAAVLGLAFLTYKVVERPLARVLRQGLKASFAQVRAGEPGATVRPAPPG